MIKAVFFDWFNTLARYEPPREELQSQTLREFGIKVSPEKLRHALWAADGDYFEENARSPIRKRTPEEQAKVYIRYQQTVLTEAGINTPVTSETLLKVMQRMRQLSGTLKFVLFGDVLPVLKTLKKQKLTVALLTNLDRDMKPLCQGLGLEPYLDFFVTSAEAGADKPEPPIFLEALKRAKADASEAVHIGDQYKVDVVGAKNVGITPILLDRYDLSPEVDCVRIHSLTEVVDYLKQ
ncbi:MAG: HAD family hydrolase [Chloroflexota bacterium]